MEVAASPYQTQPNQTTADVWLESWLGPGSLLSQCGIMLLGILLGEFLHRLILVMEELGNLRAAYGGSVMRLVWKVFSNCHSQTLTVPFLAFVGTGLLWVTANTLPAAELLKSLTTVALVYVMMRTFGALDNTLEDLEVLEENNAELGPGLAANYWFSFLKWVISPMQGQITTVKGDRVNDLTGALEEAEIKATRRVDDVEHDGQMMAKLSAAGGSDFTIFKKFIILLPSNCYMNIRSAKEWAKENVFILCHPDVPSDTKMCQCPHTGCQCPHKNCSHDFHFKVDPIQKSPPKRVTVYWIYEKEEDEWKGKDGDGKKIFLMFDFPMLLQSAMGPERGWEESDRPGARARNIQSFRDTLVSFLSSNDYNRYRHLVTFHPYTVEEGREGRGMAAQLRDMAAQLRERVRLEGRY